MTLYHETRIIFHQNGALCTTKINVSNYMKVFLESIKESSIENLVMKLLSGTPDRFSQNISPSCFLLQVPFESFTSRLPFVGPFGLVPTLLDFRMKKILEITYLL